MKRLLCILALLLALAYMLVACDEPACRHRDANDDALCDTCGEEYTDGAETPEHTHAFGGWSVTTPATCTEKGVETRTCACGESETREIEMDPDAHVSTSTLRCALCDTRVLYHRADDYIYFGEYPQTLKADNVTITATTDSRGYYLGSDNAYYTKVTADPYGNGYTFSDGSTVTDGTVYYFKVEPILWRILSQNDDTALILCDSIIANKAFDAYNDGNYSNNYAESDIRAWLNAEFYNTAFTALEQELILTTTVDNSVASTGYNPNLYACENTNDKVFLLNYAEVTNSAYGFVSSYSTYDNARQMQTSDYSRAKGAYMDTSTDYYGNGYWWLRSPSFFNSFNARYIFDDGYVDNYYSYDDVSSTSFGVVPALQIRLS